MSGMKLILRTFSIVTLSVGFVVIGDGAFLLKRLGDHAFGDPNVFYGSLEHYAAITWTGVLMCLAACLGLALAADRMKGLRAARNSALIGLATLIFGIFLFPVHDPIGRVYGDLLCVTFGASLIFVSVASARWIWYRTRQSHGVSRVNGD
jgi:multisubunit Na+/H+ antiporter MnhG subunit